MFLSSTNITIVPDVATRQELFTNIEKKCFSLIKNNDGQLRNMIWNWHLYKDVHVCTMYF